MNKWQAFLSDPELVENKWYHRRHNGKYLFGKILHDSLECLNNYKSTLTLIESHDSKISADTLYWLTSKMSVIEFTVTEFNLLWKYEQKLPPMSDKWPNLIKLAGQKLSDIQAFASDIHGLDKSSQLVKISIANLLGIQAIYEDIQVENYKKLLTTRKYQKFES